MWSIIWKFNNKIKGDPVLFKTQEQANEYAEYYKLIFRSHLNSNNIQNRFRNKEKNQTTVDYKIIENLDN
jgi:hypothetical protein